jgi:hypothetical protein
LKQGRNHTTLWLFAKGAVEAILPFCIAQVDKEGKGEPITEEQRPAFQTRIQHEMDNIAKNGLVGYSFHLLLSLKTWFIINFVI